MLQDSGASLLVASPELAALATALVAEGAIVDRPRYALGQGLPGAILLPGIAAILGALALLLKSDEPARGPVRAA